MKRRFSEICSENYTNSFKIPTKKRKLNNTENNMSQIILNQQKILEQLVQKINELEQNINNKINNITNRIDNLEKQFNPPKFSNYCSYIY